MYFSLQALLVETIHSVGLCILVFIVLPNLDPVVGMIVMLNVGTVPGLLKIMYPSRNKLDVAYGYEDNEREDSLGKMFGSVVMNVVIVLVHIGSLGLICYYILNPSSENGTDQQRREIVIYLAVACICISVNWWENFVPKGTRDSGGLSGLKRSFMRSRSKILFITMCWKIILTTCILPVIYGSLICGKNCVDMIYFKYPKLKLQVINHSSIMNTTLVDGVVLNSCEPLKKWLPYIIALIYIVLNGACFKIGKAACKVVAQRLAFGLPLAISPPISLVLLLAFMSTPDKSSPSPSLENAGEFKFGKKCFLIFPHWTDDNHNPILKMSEQFNDYWPLIVGGLLSYFSLLLMANYIWTPKKERLSSTDK